MEALARWLHPTGTVVPPAQFIPLAESSGLIHRLGELILLESTAAVSAWNSAGSPAEELWVSVNLSTRQLAGTQLVDMVRQALSESGLPAGNLHLEVTETVLMDDIGGAIGRLHELHDLGVRISIDDFGTGYSSLSYLKRLPVDTLKIDRTFIDGLSTDPSDRSIVRAIVGLTRAMGLRCLAEGVERQDHSDILVDLGCELGQGNLWSRPRPEAQARRWIASRLPAG